MEFDSSPLLVKPLDRVFPIHDRDHDIVVSRRDRTIDNDFVTVLDAGADHGIPFDREHEGGGFVANQVGVEVQAFFKILGGR